MIARWPKGTGMRPTGFEPVTSCSGGTRSIQLSYGRLVLLVCPGGRRNKPSSVSAGAEEDHFSGTAVAGRPRAAYPGLVAGRAAPRPLFGLAPGGVCRAAAVTSRAVRSYRAVSPLPVPFAHAPGHRRSAFCCTFRRLSTPGSYPAPCPAELGLSSTRQARRDPHSPPTMPRRGLEPPRPLRHQILSLACLPVSAPGLGSCPSTSLQSAPERTRTSTGYAPTRS